MSNLVELKPIPNTERVLRMALDARFLVETMDAREAVSLCLILEEARDNLSRVLERTKPRLDVER